MSNHPELELELRLLEPGEPRLVKAHSHDTAGDLLQRLIPELGIPQDLWVLATDKTAYWTRLRVEFSDSIIEHSSTLEQAGMQTGAEFRVQGVEGLMSELREATRAIKELFDNASGAFKVGKYVGEFGCCSKPPREFIMNGEAQHRLHERSTSVCCDIALWAMSIFCTLSCISWVFCCCPEVQLNCGVSESRLTAEDDEETIVSFAKPCRCCTMPCKCCCYREVVTYNSAGTKLGGTREKFWCCVPSFGVYGPDGVEHHEIRPPSSRCGCCECIDARCKCVETCCVCHPQCCLCGHLPIYIHRPGESTPMDALDSTAQLQAAGDTEFSRSAWSLSCCCYRKREPIPRLNGTPGTAQMYKSMQEIHVPGEDATKMEWDISVLVPDGASHVEKANLLGASLLLGGVFFTYWPVRENVWSCCGNREEPAPIVPMEMRVPGMVGMAVDDEEDNGPEEPEREQLDENVFTELDTTPPLDHEAPTHETNPVPDRLT
eukprot:TRINITY_DN4593_c0_g1_i4.p1 TRINITY_DN4593_c0_g1~~TRINITY_DN4593_c0_g1_i4.p1  ORF type:complete len:490 (+),score=85.74 TRINITY_DN4593_c0_g1_i4:150-1619(+)